MRRGAVRFVIGHGSLQGSSKESGRNATMASFHNGVTGKSACLFANHIAAYLENLRMESRTTSTSRSSTMTSQ